MSSLTTVGRDGHTSPVFLDSQNWSSGLPAALRPPTPAPHPCRTRARTLTLSCTGPRCCDTCLHTQESFTDNSEGTPGWSQTCCPGNVPSSHPHHLLCHQGLTIHYHVPQGGKYTSPRKKRDISLDPHPCSQFREAVGAADVFSELCLWEGRRGRASRPKGASSTLGGKPVV